MFRNTKVASLDTMHIQTLHLEAESNDKGQGYIKQYLGVTSLHISIENPCKMFNAALGRRETGFGNSYVWICVFIFVQCMPMPHAQSVLFLIRDSHSPTHKLIVPRSPSAITVSLVHDNLKQRSTSMSQYQLLLHK